MPVLWTLRLKCDDCGAKIKFVNERPSWRLDEVMMNALEESRAFVEDNPDYRSPALVSRDPNLPKYVSASIITRPVMMTMSSPFYVHCPVCDKKIYRRGKGEIPNDD